MPTTSGGPTCIARTLHHPSVTPTPHKKQKLSHGGESGGGDNSCSGNSSSSSSSSYVSAQQQQQQQQHYAPPPKVAAVPEKPKYNRKNKSLGILAASFLKQFTETDECKEIGIDQLAADLAVERRRIYDVVNILEALQVVVKMGKNTYHWMGREHLSRQFALLQQEGIEQWPEYAVRAGILDANSSKQYEATSKNEGNKSLTRLSQLFLQVFLVGLDPVNLPQASDLIHGGRSSPDELVALGLKEGDEYPTDAKKFQQVAARGLKTKIRRLYDIANVFLSVGLLRKSENRSAPTTEGKRPHFRWNYGMDILKIRQVYNEMPAHMKEKKSPFNETQAAILEKSTVNNPNYFGILTSSGAAHSINNAAASPSSNSTCSSHSVETSNDGVVVLPRLPTTTTGQSGAVASTPMTMPPPVSVTMTNSASSSESSNSNIGSCCSGVLIRGCFAGGGGGGGGDDASSSSGVEGSFLRNINVVGGAGGGASTSSPRRISLSSSISAAAAAAGGSAGNQ